MSASRHSLNTSASVAGSSGSTTLAGASTTVATMLSGLDDISDGDLLGLARESLDRNAMKERATNLRKLVSELHKNPAKLPKTKWKSNEQTARTVQVAALCSKAVYRKDLSQIIPELPGYTNKARHWIEPTRDGSGKAAALFEIAPADPSSRRRILVVAVRGSASLIDWLVNLNIEPASCSDLVNLPDAQSKPAAKVHCGFARCARTIAPDLLTRVKAALHEFEQQNRDVEIVFAGHSAGGAVACLLFCHFLTCQVLDVRLTKKPTLSCISFGCPPFLDTDIGLRLTELFHPSPFLPGICLAFVNEGDPIPRMDEAYAKSLVDVWHRAGGAGCVTTTELPEFKPPKLGLKSLGDLVVLFDKEQEFDENQEEDSEDEKLMACHLDRCDLEQQAWANVLAHSMDQYEKWTTLIGNGRFNGRVDWEATSVQCTCVCN